MYLMYSAYFLQSDLIGITSIINSLMTVVYFSLGVTNLRSILSQLVLMKQLLNEGNEGIPAPYIESIKLKVTMLKQLKYFIILFFTPKIMLYFYESKYPKNDFLQVRLNTAVIVFECYTFGFLLWIFRPRKEWPDFFLLGLGGLADEAQRRGRPDMDLNQVINNMVPIIISNIDNNFLQKGMPGFSRQRTHDKNNKNSFSSDGSFSSFGSMTENQAILVVNPNDYTLSDIERCTVTPNFNGTQINNSISPAQMVDINNPYTNFEQLNEQAVCKVQVSTCLGFRDKKQKQKIDKLKAKGLYK